MKVESQIRGICRDLQGIAENCVLVCIVGGYHLQQVIRATYKIYRIQWPECADSPLTKPPYIGVG